MKKNAMLKIAAILMVAVLLTTCAISSTFAKYVTSKSDSDSARVAKWGVDVVTTVDGLFLTEYDNKAVASTEAVVAPGTGSGEVSATSVITGEPEVKVMVTSNVTLALTGWSVDGTFYCPLVFTVNGKTVNGLDHTSDVSLIGAIADAGKIEKTIEAGVKLDDYKDSNEKAINTAITWNWAFEDTNEGAKQTNLKDTALGDAAADGNAPTIAITIETIVSQLDN